MVAPTRTPQARGVKCDLCKKILSNATWLDQTKLAKNVEEAEHVINLLDKHNSSGCPCIPRNIENLLVGSTHFEVHRLVFKRLDELVHKKQYEYFMESKQRATKEASKNKNKIYNDCDDNNKNSRFKHYPNFYEDNKNQIAASATKHLQHLKRTIDYWRKAMEDTASPFNSKLALRLGLTHHVIYACYLFKFYKLLDYQLMTANLLLNLFKSIEGVTANAVLHANYLLAITLIDCGQVQLARNYLKTLNKTANYQDKSHYESILMTCASCELDLLEGVDSYDNLDLLADLAKLQHDDKLQHYYARTFALQTVIKYIHKFPARSDLCFEFYHTFRYMSAIIRRCYESSFDLVLPDREGSHNGKAEAGSKKGQILDHNWIRFAVCDFVFSTFDTCSNFYLKSGQPENLQLLYHGLNLIAYRSGSIYWQGRIALIGARLELLCDKIEHCQAKLDMVESIIRYTEDSYLANVLDSDLEVNRLELDLKQNNVIERTNALELLQKANELDLTQSKQLCKIELYDCEQVTVSFATENQQDESKRFIVLNNMILCYISFSCLKVIVLSLVRSGDVKTAKNLIQTLGNQLKSWQIQILPYYQCHLLQEILMICAGVEHSNKLLLASIQSTNLFIEFEDGLGDIDLMFSKLNLETDKAQTQSIKRKIIGSKSKKPLVRYSRRRRNYEVARLSEENLNDNKDIRFFDTIEAVKNVEALSNEEIVVSYLRNTEPNPDYLLYRKAHEMMFCFKLKDDSCTREQLLYHFCESSTSNTMRYRWMMFEEQQSSPYEQTNGTKTMNPPKYLGFCNTLANIENMTKSMVRSIPDDFKLIQLKYVLDKASETEHLLVVSFDNQNEPIYIHTRKSLISEDFSGDTKTKSDDSQSLPTRFTKMIEEAKLSLLYTNQVSKTEKRNELERDIGLLLCEFEEEWLGPFRIILCGKLTDTNYRTFIQEIATELESLLKHPCLSSEALKLVLENAPLLDRDELQRLLGILFDYPMRSKEVVDSYDKWYKALNQYVAQLEPKRDRIVYFEALSRSQVGLILDRELEHLPIESLPTSRIRKQGMFRVPSLRLFYTVANQQLTSTSFIDTNETAYILDPANNLEKTRDRFKSKLTSQKRWSGVIGKAPRTDTLEEWLSTKQIYIFIGHGAGSTYYNKLCKNRGLGLMPRVRSTSIIMGCSSGRVLAEGPNLESFGIGWIFIFRGAPAYLGLLWDVTDTDIDKFLDSFLDSWMGPSWISSASSSSRIARDVSEPNSCCSKRATIKSVALTDAVAQVRQVCRLKFLIGATPIVYGLPIWCKI